MHRVPKRSLIKQAQAGEWIARSSRAHSINLPLAFTLLQLTTATMRITPLVLSACLALDLGIVIAFSPSRSFRRGGAAADPSTTADAPVTNVATSTSSLHAIGLGPGEDEESSFVAIAEQPVVPEVETDHEQYRTSRLTKIDEQCDEWYGALLGTSDETTYLGDVSVEARRRILTLPELKRAVSCES